MSRSRPRTACRTPANLRVENEGAAGFLLTDGRRRVLMLDDQTDAANAVALARAHTAHWFVGRSNQRTNRETYTVESWKGGPGAATLSNEDCISYNTGALRIANEEPTGLLITDGRSRMMMVDNHTDAANALTLARAYSRQCFIGRDNRRSDPSTYVVAYWR